MPKNTKQRDEKFENDMPTGRKDRGMGGHDNSGVDGIAGTGGSSGTGSVRTDVPDELGQVSGITPDVDVPPPGSVGKHPGGTRDLQQNDGGLSGKTRGPDSETMPNQTEPSKS
ncbi:MAG TPA: hypothetical protein VFT99_19315 [Roseiflexaceae bacterium]|nr:hypothetical protein [Roseiflexaceae bacterium]